MTIDPPEGIAELGIAYIVRVETAFTVVIEG